MFNTSVASITAGLARIVSRLEAHAVTQQKLSEEHRMVSTRHLDMAAAAVREVTQANAVRAKLAALISA